MLTARDIALRTLLQWTNPGEPPFLPERGDQAWHELSPRDRAFAFDLLTGILRWRSTLDVVIASRLRQPLDSLDHPLRAILWLGAYQLLFQSGTAAYAAVDTTVTLAHKDPRTAKASGLVNAVLRGILRLEPTAEPRKNAAIPAHLSRRAFDIDFEARIVLNTDVFPSRDAGLDVHLATIRSHPVPYVKHLRGLFGNDVAGELLLHDNVRPAITLRSDMDALDVPALAGLAAHAEAARFLIAAEGWNPLIESLVHKGTLSPQDPTAAKPVRRVAEAVRTNQVPAPVRILDLCAGLGTKSMQLGRTFPQASVVAADVDAGKLAKLAARAALVRQTNITTRVLPAVAVAPEEGDRFEVVLVDVPCSNTGVMAKRVQSRWRWPTLNHAELHALQQRLFHQGAALVAPGGVVVYSTCSIDPAENQQLVAAAMAASPVPLRLLAEEATLPNLTARQESVHDGGYYAICIRVETAP
jgi:16S rRNA (cytosine967-C5)-methyltransferase